MDRRQFEIDQILDFIGNHRESYASLAVCRRALDQGLAYVTNPVLESLDAHLREAPDREVDAYFSIVN